MAEFKKLAAVDMVETASDTATVLIEEDGVVKRAPKSTIGTVKSVNGIEADENGNVEIETAANWNDLADKPFYEGEVALFESTIILDQYGSYNFDSNLDLVGGQEYICIVDSIKYVDFYQYLDPDMAIPLRSENGDYIGDIYPYGIYFNTNYIDITEPHEIKISYQGIQQIDEKFLPDSVVIDSDIVSLQNTLQTKIDTAQTTADDALTNAAIALTTVDSKMNQTNPTGSGYFSLNRQAESDTTPISSNSYAIGDGTVANRTHMMAQGMYNKYEDDLYAVVEDDKENLYGLSSTATVWCSNEYILNQSTASIELIAPVETTGGDLNTINSYQYIKVFGRIPAAKRTREVVRANSNLLYYTSILVVDAKNAKGKYSHIVGNGKSDSVRSNAHTLDWQGNAWYSGDVYIGSTSGTNRDEGSKKLATEEFVLEKAGGGAVHTHSWNDLEDKPFGEEAELTTIVDNTSIVPDGNYNVIPVDGQTILTKQALFEGETYIVNWYGTDYTVVCFSYDGGGTVNAIGNTLFAGGGFNDMPFTIMDGYLTDAANRRRLEVISMTADPCPETISIKHVVPSSKTLDEKYIPDTIARVSDIKAVSYDTEQTLTDEQKAQVRANISKYDWRDITIANQNYTIADYSPASLDTYMTQSAFDIDAALACTGVVSANYSSIATIAHMANMLFGGALQGLATVKTATKNIAREYDNLKANGIIAETDLIYICHKGTNDNIKVAYYIGVADGEHVVTICESQYGYAGNIRYNSETDIYNTEYFTGYADGDKTLTKAGMSADSKAVGDALALKADQTSLDEVSTLVGNTSVNSQISNALANVAQLPAVTEADNGKVLMVVNGKWQLVTLNLSVDENGVMTIK